jgi:hypothetical protein
VKIGLFSIGAGRAAQPETIVQLAQKAEEVAVSLDSVDERRRSDVDRSLVEPGVKVTWHVRA